MRGIRAPERLELLELSELLERLELASYLRGNANAIIPVGGAFGSGGVWAA